MTKSRFASTWEDFIDDPLMRGVEESILTAFKNVYFSGGAAALGCALEAASENDTGLEKAIVDLCAEFEAHLDMMRKRKAERRP